MKHEIDITEAMISRGVEESRGWGDGAPLNRACVQALLLAAIRPPQRRWADSQREDRRRDLVGESVSECQRVGGVEAPHGAEESKREPEIGETYRSITGTWCHIRRGDGWYATRAKPHRRASDATADATRKRGVVGGERQTDLPASGVRCTLCPDVAGCCGGRRMGDDACVGGKRFYDKHLDATRRPLTQTQIKEALLAKTSGRTRRPPNPTPETIGEGAYAPKIPPVKGDKADIKYRLDEILDGLSRIDDARYLNDLHDMLIRGRKYIQGVTPAKSSDIPVPGMNARKHFREGDRPNGATRWFQHHRKDDPK